MAFEVINLQTKFNKGTSKDEWGNFNYWGYKAPDGLIRARLFAPDANGLCLLSVKKFELSPNSWRRKVTWDDAIDVGSSFVKISDTSKGFTSDEALKQVNALIEIHNDYFNEHVGRKVRQPQYGGGHDSKASVVTGVAFEYNENEDVIVHLMGDRWNQKLSEVLDYTDDFAKEAVQKRLAEVQDELYKAQEFITKCRQSYLKGERVERAGGSYDKVGLLPYSTANELAGLVNQFVPEEVTA